MSSTTPSPSEGLLKNLGTMTTIEAQSVTKGAKRDQMFQKLAQSPIRHEACDPVNWPFKLMGSIGHTSVDKVVSIVQVIPDETQIIFVVMEATEILTSEVIRRVTGLTGFRLVEKNEGEYDVVTLEQAARHPHDSPLQPQFIFSTSLQSTNLRLHLQLTESSYVSLNQPALVNMLKATFPVLSKSLTEFSSSADSSNSSDVTKSPSDRIDAIEEFLRSVVNAYGRSRRAFRTMNKSNSNNREKDRRILDDLRERYGPLHEEIIRQSVTLAYGVEYGLSLEIRGLSDIIMFVGAGFGMTGEQKSEARTRLIKKLCRDSQGFLPR